MSQNIDLRAYVPPEAAEQVHINDELAIVVARILTIIPPEEIFGLFSSKANETGGVQRFPWCRVDAELVICRNYLDLIKSNPTFVRPMSEDEIAQKYELASLSAMQAIVWVEIGFEGLDNLAVSHASKNWTATGGHFMNEEERAKGIKSSGREMYNKFLRQFVAYRDQNHIENDVFSRLRIESLLDQWRK